MLKISVIDYATRVWLTAVFMAPIMVFAGVLMGAGWNSGNFTEALATGAVFFAIMSFTGFIASIPSWLLLLLAVKKVRNLPWEEWNKKTVLLGIATLLTILPFALLSWKEPEEILNPLIGLYWFPVSIAIFINRL